MIVLSLVALITGLVVLRLQPSAQQQLLQESERLAVWLESARQLARTEQRVVQARIGPEGAVLIGLSRPPAGVGQLGWLYPGITQPPSEQMLWLGPEAILPPQKLALTSRRQPEVQVVVGTSGIGPWRVQP